MYNREKAVNYAHKWWNSRNPNFYNFDNLGGDCTNFISQCLYAGEIAMDYSTKGWFFTSLNNRSPSWTGVDEFFNYALSNRKYQGVKVKLVPMHELSIGDVIQFRQRQGNFNHSLLVTKITDSGSPSGIFVTCHTIDSIDRPLSNYNFYEARFLKIMN